MLSSSLTGRRRPACTPLKQGELPGRLRLHMGQGRGRLAEQLPGRDRALYLAGLWNDYGGQRRCVILTTAANPSMAGIHDRMPLVLERERLAEWVHSPQAAGELLRRTPPALEHVEEEPPRQLSLF